MKMYFVPCKKCGGRAAMWKYPDHPDHILESELKLQLYEITCVDCDETTGWVEGRPNPINGWNEGETHPSVSYPGVPVEGEHV